MQLCPRLLTASNANLIALFQLLGPGVLRVGGNSVDRATWTSTGAAKTTGQGTLHSTNLSAGGLNATAYAVKTSAGTNLVLVNKDSSQNLQTTVQMLTKISSATLLRMSQRTAGNTGPDLVAPAGVTLQGAGISAVGGFTPGSAYILNASCSQLTSDVPCLSAVSICAT